MNKLKLALGKTFGVVVEFFDSLGEKLWVLARMVEASSLAVKIRNSWILSMMVFVVLFVLSFYVLKFVAAHAPFLLAVALFFFLSKKIRNLMRMFGLDYESKDEI